MPQEILRITDATAGNPAYRLAQPVNLTLFEGENAAIIGPNGAGKTMLTGLITGQYPPLFRKGSAVVRPEGLRSITFRDSYGSADATHCYQQRWNSFESDEYPLVCEVFPTIEDDAWRNELFTTLSIDRIWNSHTISLSSGEMRRYQLARALASRPGMLIIDSPFIGLDPATRDTLASLLENLSTKWNICTVLVLAREDEIPSYITHIIPVSDRICHGKMTVQEWRDSAFSKPCDTPDMSRAIGLMRSLPYDVPDSEEVVNCRSVSLKYGTRTILDNLDWTVRKGEHWSLLGPNGSGKSALLSMVYADNPQSYATDITLFGRRRGTGESIWEIKRHIGYVSPEMHRSYMQRCPVQDIVASGLHDTAGLFRRIRPEEVDICRTWLSIFGIDGLAERDFMTLSSGEQRMVLLARAFVKNPALLILDEPMHGLDDRARQQAAAIINAFCQQSGKTSIFVTHYPEELPEGITNTLKLVRH